MARTDWAALVTEPAAEYTASAELVRFGLQPYLPQVRRRHRAQGLALVRLYPLFPRYSTGGRFAPVTRPHNRLAMEPVQERMVLVLWALTALIAVAMLAWVLWP